MIHSVTSIKSLFLVFLLTWFSYLTKKTFGKAESNALKNRETWMGTNHRTSSGPLLGKPFENKQCKCFIWPMIMTFLPDPSLWLTKLTKANLKGKRMSSWVLLFSDTKLEKSLHLFAPIFCLELLVIRGQTLFKVKIRD